MRDRRVLFISSGGLLAGAERCLVEAASQLARGHCAPVTVVPYEGRLSRELRRRGIDVHVMELGVIRTRTELRSARLLLRLVQVVPACWKLIRLIRRERIEIIHSNTSAVVAGGLAALVTRRPHVWHVREILPGEGLQWRFMRWLIPHLSEQVLCISTAVKSQFDGNSSRTAAKLQVVHDGVTVEEFATAAASRSHRKRSLRVGTLSRINPWKGHRTFIEAAAKVARLAPDVQFFIVGECLSEYAPLKNELVELARGLGISRNVRFTGYLPYERVKQIVSSFDVFVLPSSSPEPLGIVMLEAMAAGKPVVATKHGGPLDVVEDGLTGLLVSPDDPQPMAEAILALLHDETRRQEMGRAGAERARLLFSVEGHVAQLEKVYDDILFRREKRSGDGTSASEIRPGPAP